LQGKQVRQVLDSVAAATETKWEAQRDAIVFRGKSPEDPLLPRLRKMGLLKRIDETKAALELMRSLDDKQWAGLRTNGFIPYAELTQDQRLKQLSIPTGRGMPTVDGFALIKLPEKDLFFIGAFYVELTVVLDATTQKRLYAYHDRIWAQFPEMARPLKAFREKQSPAAPGDALGPAEGNARMLAFAGPLAWLTGVFPGVAASPAEALQLDARDPPIFALSELGELIRAKTGREIYVDARLGVTKLWLVHRHGPLTADRLMALMAETTGWAWREVGETRVLVEHVHSAAPMAAQEDQVLLELQNPLRAEMLKMAMQLWNPAVPPPPEESVRMGPPMAWAAVPEPWQKVIRKQLRHMAENPSWSGTGRPSREDIERGMQQARQAGERLAKFLWAPRGMDNATVGFSLGIVTIVAIEKGHYGGLVTEGIAVPERIGPR